MNMQDKCEQLIKLSPTLDHWRGLVAGYDARLSVMKCQRNLFLILSYFSVGVIWGNAYVVWIGSREPSRWFWLFEITQLVCAVCHARNYYKMCRRIHCMTIVRDCLKRTIPCLDEPALVARQIEIADEAMKEYLTI